MPVVSRKVLRTTEGLAGGLIVILWIEVVLWPLHKWLNIERPIVRPLRKPLQKIFKIEIEGSYLYFQYCMNLFLLRRSNIENCPRWFIFALRFIC